MKERIRQFISSCFPKDETTLLAVGALLSKQPLTLDNCEFKIFSQFGDDGVIQYLIQNIKIENKLFVEFGVQDYLESNTRFLMMNNNWSGLVMDCGKLDLKKHSWFWKYDLQYKSVFITKDNINDLLPPNIGLLSIDIDGNDYHVWEAITQSPPIVIIEYNAAMGYRNLIVPYREDFDRSKAHYSHLYWGASITALNALAIKKGYRFAYATGNNAYFVRKDLFDKDIPVKTGESKFRDSRNPDGTLSYITDKWEVIKDLLYIRADS